MAPTSGAAESLLRSLAIRAAELRRLLHALDTALETACHSQVADGHAQVAEACVACAVHASRCCGLGNVPADLLEVTDLAVCDLTNAVGNASCATTSSADLHDAELWDDALGLLARSVIRMNANDGVVEAGQAVAAATRFLLLPAYRRDSLCDAMDAALADGGDFWSARRAALSTARRAEKSLDAEAAAHESVAADDDLIREVLYRCLVEAVASPVLEPLGFPASKVGLRSLIGAARTGPRRSQRACAILGRAWHASDGAAPLLLSEAPTSVPTPWGPTEPPPPPEEGVTLVVAFSSLGWEGVVRAEWGATLSALVGEGRVVVAHALDTAMSWFTTDPTSGEADGGAWWDAALGLATPSDSF